MLKVTIRCKIKEYIKTKFSNMRYPKNFAKLTTIQQEQWLVSKLQEIHQLEQEIKITLGKIRGGEVLIFKEIDRPDLALMKDEN
jgi:hypothetical protein